MGWMELGGELGSAAIGALGTGFAGQDSAENERLAKERAKTERSKRAGYEAAQQPTQLIAGFLARDRMLSMQPGPIGSIGRILNAADFVNNQALPYMMISAEKGAQAKERYGIPTAQDRWRAIMERLQSGRERRQERRRNTIGALLGGGR